MNRPSYDEYEEVESPYAPRAAKPSPQRERLRTRKNVFNRPFATDSSSAPIIETTSTRRTIGHADNTDFIDHRQSELAETEIDYLEEDEEEEVEETALTVRRPSKTANTKKASKLQKNLLTKVGWAVIGLLVLRLIFMDRGVYDYFSTENVIYEQEEELLSIKNENKELKTEIARIQVDKGYQKQLAKEHLGVIAGDEFLILFAGEIPEAQVVTNNQI